MDKQGFIDFNTRLSPENSGKADSYARAIQVLDEVLPYQDVVDLHRQSLYQVSDTAVIEAILHLVNDEVKKMKLQQQNIFDDYGKPNQRSYPLKSFCSAALKSLKKYAQYMQDVNEADRIVAQEADPRSISTRLIDHFNLTKEGEDVVSESKRRKGQDYFRRMILTNYGGRCALTGMDIPQLLLASHIIPWAEKAHKQDRLNPCNGICLSALYDKAFDQGLITFSPDDYSVILSSALQEHKTAEYYDKHFGSIAGQKIQVPKDYAPKRDFLAYHRDHVFVGR
ncbi:HNH endonuclease [Prevotella sp. kh1p2]|uniref:HNH endonuclease n=1 Tax=Prevotella sp. kh1p2 TaxID=1761883 RepID=UPI0008B5039D|nr:HNH endonuclease [Prevotella sp. kh1p2]SES68406.1 putative restriction endonuclease [Prevotella sp. kh1p2]SNU12459.1 putative restriction endonuclease [Prevotellaceae bacterium KH2P17]